MKKKNIQLEEIIKLHEQGKSCHKNIHSKDNHEPSPFIKGKVQRLSLNESTSQAIGDGSAENPDKNGL